MAEKYLLDKGYEIIEKNYRNSFGEIDLIAKDNTAKNGIGKNGIVNADKGMICYVEVKYRASQKYGDPLEAVDRKKQRRISKVAEYHYTYCVADHNIGCRFDVIGIYEDGSIRHIENAFDFYR